MSSVGMVCVFCRYLLPIVMLPLSNLRIGILPGAQAFSHYGCIYRENAKAAKKIVTILFVFDSSNAVQMLDKRLRLWSTLPHNWASMKSSVH